MPKDQRRPWPIEELLRAVEARRRRDPMSPVAPRRVLFGGPIELLRRDAYCFRAAVQHSPTDRLSHFLLR
jgi:hypothetical protein